MKPVEELSNLRKHVKNKLQITRDTVLEGTTPEEWIFEPNTINSSFAISLKDSEDNYFEITYSSNDKRLTLRLKDQYKEDKQEIQSENISELRLFLDNGLTELFVNYGEFVFTNKWLSKDNYKCSMNGTLSVCSYSLKNLKMHNPVF
ncbi:GH32 C-terminal domain-containing protein [Amphibacillus sp. Q70]|uniref:GH32 C-terminal domain-containing protein n=1 Tax=Amphibacillus sp. Q70 TaxID=3453416 RepID=UPI003F859FEE